MSDMQISCLITILDKKQARINKIRKKPIILHANLGHIINHKCKIC